MLSSPQGEGWRNEDSAKFIVNGKKGGIVCLSDVISLSKVNFVTLINTGTIALRLTFTCHLSGFPWCYRIFIDTTRIHPNEAGISIMALASNELPERMRNRSRVHGFLHCAHSERNFIPINKPRIKMSHSCRLTTNLRIFDSNTYPLKNYCVINITGSVNSVCCKAKELWFTLRYYNSYMKRRWQHSDNFPSVYFELCFQLVINIFRLLSALIKRKRESERKRGRRNKSQRECTSAHFADLWEFNYRYLIALCYNLVGKNTGQSGCKS